jgi:hypothetical protein
MDAAFGSAVLAAGRASDPYVAQYMGHDVRGQRPEVPAERSVRDGGKNALTIAQIIRKMPISDPPFFVARPESYGKGRRWAMIVSAEESTPTGYSVGTAGS